MPPSTDSYDSTVTFTQSAKDAHSECVSALMEANQWAEHCDADDTVETLNARRERFIAMQHSLYSNLAHLLTGGTAHDGPLTIWRDSECCFFWKYERSGYHGGLILHRDYAEHGNERLPVGRWSIHT